MLWVLIDMTYNMGNRFVKGFPKFWSNLEKAIQGSSGVTFNDVIDEMIDSRWFYQTGRRGRMLINLIIS